jgi:DNA-directed RNA polymerase specialized sigma24 family protein
VDRAERFSELYRAQCDAVLSYAWRRTDQETARDVVAETFLVAWRRAERVMAKLSQQHRDGHAPDTAAEVTQRARLDRALASLTASDQEALRLVGWEELDLAEAALAMGCSRSAMAVRLHRARRRLERALGTGDGQEGTPAARPAPPARAVSQETR